VCVCKSIQTLTDACIQHLQRVNIYCNSQMKSVKNAHHFATVVDFSIQPA